jgi:hypothetical protein
MSKRRKWQLQEQELSMAETLGLKEKNFGQRCMEQILKTKCLACHLMSFAQQVDFGVWRVFKFQFLYCLYQAVT